MSYHETLAEIVDLASKAIADITEDTLSFKTDSVSWSKKEILGHLIDSAINNCQRILDAQLKDDLLFDGYDQVAWVRLNDYQSREIQEVLETWESINIHIVQLVSKIPDDIMNRQTIEHNFDKMSMLALQKGEETNLGYLIWDYIYHIEHHLSQIIEDYKKLLGPYKS